ncbi:RecX family transcriptional regulator [Candidatus Saccharibacteria bacterium]|nr:RecX family transcriptional regulator [Candidatus Saccharibacteria bacterium]
MNFRVTEIRQGVKNPNRVNIFLDGKFSFSLDIAQVVDLKIKIGKEISEEELSELKRESEFGKLYQRVLEKALTRPHSEKEIRDYLYRKLKMSSSDTRENNTELINRIVERLRAKNYIDDLKFAEYYVQNRFVKKGISQRRLSMELMKKGVRKEIINEVLGGRNDEEEILKIIKKKRAKYTDEKLISYLVRQGFSFELARELVSSFETGSRNSE